MNDAPGAKINQRMYELRAEGLTVPETTARLEAEGYRVPGNALPDNSQERPSGDRTTA
ncbi:recombinase family protein [Streptomyces halobius]|uniref:Recombinase family protein n=1 Tax=Streptomyces halobius TaxID=2879846 RepID=A0ABY4MAZ9_9ACTN|nr:recombinase family protein [Streptomyces halobius]UQA94959.1 recombinase family protein [Streptomyces halobius]